MKEAVRKGSFWEKLNRGEKPVIVELTPPATSDISKYLECAKALRDKKIDMITISDSPGAIARVASPMIASRIKSELGMTVLPHLTCRDRNTIAIKSLAMGLCANEIRNILIVTGDPIEDDNSRNARDEKFKGVFEMNSKQMAKSIRSLYEKEIDVPFNIFGALNINANNFDKEIERANEKIEAGMCGFLTQPVHSEMALKNLKRAKEEIDSIIIGGVMPIISEKNAVYMNEKVPGIKVDEKIIKAYHEAKKEDCKKLAVDISIDVAKKMEPFVDGYYIMTPFLRSDIVCDIIDGLV